MVNTTFWLLSQLFIQTRCLHSRLRPCYVLLYKHKENKVPPKNFGILQISHLPLFCFLSPFLYTVNQMLEKAGLDLC